MEFYKQYTPHSMTVGSCTSFCEKFAEKCKRCFATKQHNSRLTHQGNFNLVIRKLFHTVPHSTMYYWYTKGYLAKHTICTSVQHVDLLSNQDQNQEYKRTKRVDKQCTMRLMA